MNQKKIEQSLRKQKDNAGMLFTKLHYKEKKKGLLSASIKIDFTEINIALNTNAGWNDVYETAKALTEHEIGHWKTCPYDLSYHLEITSSVIEVVKQKLPQMNLSKDPMKNNFIHSITNIYEDIIDNLFIDGHNFSEIYAKTSNTGKGKVGKNFQFALAVQLQLWGIDEDYKLLMPIIEKEPYDSATSYLAEIGLNKNDSLIRKRRVFGYKDSWSDYAEKFTKYFLKYYDPNEEQKQKSQQNQQKEKGEEQEGDGQRQQSEQGQEQDGQEKQGKGKGKKENEEEEQEKDGQGSGKGQKEENDEEQEEEEDGQGSGKGEKEENEEEQEEEEDGQGSGKGQKEENDEEQEEEEDGQGCGQGQEEEYENDEEPTIIIDNNPFDEDMKDVNKVKRALGKIANRKGMGPAQKVSKNIIKDDIVSMDILLDSISPEIQVKHKNENEGYGFPIVPINKKFMDEDDIDSTILGVGIDELGEPNLEVGKMYFPIDIYGPEKAKQIPDFLYIVDDSGSMGGLSVGERYFMAMMGLYGTKNWLAKNGHLDYINFGLVQFSDTTRLWGFDKFEYAYEMKKMILNPQGWGTELNVDLVKQMINNHNKKLIIIMLSDGSIGNWSSINKEFINLITPHQFTFLGIGGLGNAGEELKKNGFNTINVSDSSKMHEIIIDAASASYSNF